MAAAAGMQVTASLAAAEHRQMAINSVGVDAPQETDLFYRFAVTTCFFVGGLGSTHKVRLPLDAIMQPCVNQSGLVWHASLHPAVRLDWTA